jgi:hypothetical protein
MPEDFHPCYSLTCITTNHKSSSHILFIFILITLSIAQIIQLQIGVNNELENTWKEKIMDSFYIILQQLPGEPEEKQEKPVSKQLISRLQSEPKTSHIQSRGSTFDHNVGFELYHPTSV